MRMLVLATTSLSLVFATAANGAASERRGNRQVQLILMDSVVPSVPIGGVQTSRGSAEMVPPVDTWQIHDLSRRWVRFEMESDFARQAAARAPTPISPDPNDPFAHVGRAQPAAGGLAQQTHNAASAIAVPRWMTEGLAFAGAAASYAPGCQSGGYRPAGFLGAATENRRANYYAMMSGIACQYGIPVGLFDAMIIRESRYQPWVYSPKNAFGLTQLMPATAAALGVDRYDVEQNMRGGARYLREQLDRFGTAHLALAAYNAGPGRVKNRMVPEIAETQAYVADILANWTRLSGFARSVSVQPADLAQMPAARGTRSATVSSF